MGKYYGKIKSALSGRENEVFSSSEIVDIVIERYPSDSDKRGSIIPSDYCYNRINNDPSVVKKFKGTSGTGTREFLFLCLEAEKYKRKYLFKYVGENYPYDGPIYHLRKGERSCKHVGNWENGVPILFDDLAPIQVDTIEVEVQDQSDRVAELSKLLKAKYQIILQGAPGTGKTRLAQEIAYKIIKDRPLSPDKEARQDELKALKQDGNYRFIQFHPAYSYEDFVRGMVATTDKGNIKYEVQDKVLADIANEACDDKRPFVLIIDEINRANLPAVLGELIYALEYRGQAVESMYEKDGDRAITLPDNLLIIGTMNTADRSVGHIDYAIRRRFAFVDVKPDASVIPQGKARDLFNHIETLFGDHLSPDFDQDDVLPGHSYFLGDDLEKALQYAIKPILREYVKDGVLTDTADTKAKIKALSAN